MATLDLGVGKKARVAFICVHNSCRSQMAEAIARLKYSEVFESYSAGTELKDKINQDSVRLIKEIYGIDMEASQRNKLISEIPTPDVAIFMGCDVTCPLIDYKYSEDWALDDPTDKGDEFMKNTIELIEKKLLALSKTIAKS